jgi:hypothetical protein
MKLTASILIASAHAQTRGRDSKDTDNENTDAGAFGDAFADYFGGYDYGGLGESFDYSGFDDQSFGNYNDAFGTDAPATNAPTAAPTVAATVAATAAPTMAATEDPFAGYDFSGADDSFASYDGADDSATLDDTVADIVADVVDAAGRPDGNDNESGKSSTFIQNSATITLEGSPLDLSQYSAFCFVGSSEADFDLNTGKPDVTQATDDWFANGNWHHCSGENEVCQIKVTRRRNEIFSIVSKCANNKSCVDNMKTNYAPHWDPSGSQVYAASWARQACRPTFGESSLANFNGAASARARGGNPSECFYCVEPCRSRAAAVDGVDWDASSSVTDPASEKTAMANEYCIGKGSVEGGENSIAFQTFDIFNEASWAGIAPTQGTWDVLNRIDGALLVSDLTLTRTDIHGEDETYTTTVSNIQMEQIRQRVDRGQGQAEVADLVDGFASN